MQSESNTKKVVYFVRHGQSVDNVAPVFQSADCPLSPKGQQQAKRIADRISHLPIEALVTSPLRRAHETAEVISGVIGIKADVSDLFVERIKPTGLEGKPWTDAKASALWREWGNSLFNSGDRVSDGENYDAIVARADRALEYLNNRAEHSIVVVTHGYFLRTIIARVLLGDTLTGDSHRRFQTLAAMENTGITVMEYRDAFEEELCWRLWTYNDHAHFAE
ncbi:MAG TPA: histidine phosphatase family protein [Patescibacteria group bacterium]|nr:histidine phosphatase family protein [Patescibacteria group bacterium]